MTQPIKKSRLSVSTRPLHPSSDRLVGVICVDGQPVEQTCSATNAESIMAWFRNWLKRANEKRVLVDLESQQEPP